MSNSLLQGVICSILTIDDQNRLRPLACPGLPQAFSRSLDGLPIGPDVGSCGAAAYLGYPIEVSDIDLDPRWALYKELPLANGLRACWSSPIKGRDARVVGTFAFYYRTRRGPSKLERRIVEMSVHLCALAIERERVRCHLQLANHRFDVILNNMSQGVSFFGDHLLIVANRRYSEIYGLSPTKCCAWNVTSADSRPARRCRFWPRHAGRATISLDLTQSRQQTRLQTPSSSSLMDE